MRMYSSYGCGLLRFSRKNVSNTLADAWIGFFRFWFRAWKPFLIHATDSEDLSHFRSHLINEQLRLVVFTSEARLTRYPSPFNKRSSSSTLGSVSGVGLYSLLGTVFRAAVRMRAAI